MNAIETAALLNQTGHDGAAELDVSVVIPCLDEAEAIAFCVRRAREAMDAGGLRGEVVVVDNGSTDGSGALAGEAGARVVLEPRRGYGSAYLAGFAAARGRYIVMGDADASYDFAQLGRFVEPLEDGADLVMGSRLRGNIQPGAMPWLHRYVGNPFLTGLLNLFFRSGVSDAHCGMRAFRRDLLPRLDLRATGMEFASEHVIRSSKLGLDIREIPIDYHPRAGRSKLSSFSDGWRHLRFLLVHSPTWLFLVPAMAMLVAGVAAGAVVVAGIDVFGRQWQIHTLIAAAMSTIVGAQVLQLGICARAYAVYHLGERDALFDRLRSRLRLEHGLMVGGLVLLAGLVGSAVVVGVWLDRGFGDIQVERLAVASLALVVLGIQTVFGAFFVSILGLRRRRALEEAEAPESPAAVDAGVRRFSRQRA